MVNAQQWLDQNYPKYQRSEIKKLDIRNKYLTGDLNLTGFNNLTELDCSFNNLTNLNFINTLPCPEKLTSLNIKINNITGSLVPLQPCLKLEWLNIRNTNLTPDLQYLPLSLSGIGCDGKIEAELTLYGNNLAVWQAAHPQLMQQTGQEIVIDNQDYNQIELKTVTTTPQYLAEHLNQETNSVDSHSPTNLNYSQFSLRDGRPFAWEKITSEQAITQKLPFRLYNIEKNKIEKTEGKVGRYAVLSYVWGKAGGLMTEEKKELDKIWGKNKEDHIGYKNSVNLSGYRAWKKAIETCKYLGINYLWMDQLCIDQNEVAEKKQEVPKMRQYYSNASATLIAIDNSVGEAKESEAELAKHIIKQIVTSPWFKRSWTFQEGLLSKQTIFMFDDKIVDGRSLANYWGGVQEANSSTSNLKTIPSIFITPLGWSYGAQPNQKVELGLSQALHAVSHRQQTVPLDGLYSILGLLPYGQDVKANYKSNLCSSCKKQEVDWYKANKKAIICSHPAEQKTEYPKYFVAELNAELRKMMELAIDKGYSYEPFSWAGVRHVEPELWMIPPLKEDGTSEITGFVEFEDSVKVSATGWELVGGKCLVSKNLKKTGRKVGDIIIQPGREQIKSTNKLEITLPVADKATRPIIFENVNGAPYGNNKFFLDMVNKELITGEELITQYQQQLPLIQQQKQSFSLVYDWQGNNVTVNNSLVWQVQEQTYLVVNQQLQAVNIWKENIDSAFTDSALISAWTNQHWTYGPVQEWADYLRDKFNPQEYDFYTWVRDVKKLDWRDVRRQENKLKQEFQTYQAEQSVAQMEISPK